MKVSSFRTLLGREDRRRCYWLRSSCRRRRPGNPTVRPGRPGIKSWGPRGKLGSGCRGPTPAAAVGHHLSPRRRCRPGAMRSSCWSLRLPRSGGVPTALGRRPHCEPGPGGGPEGLRPAAGCTLWAVCRSPRSFPPPSSGWCSGCAWVGGSSCRRLWADVVGRIVRHHLRTKDIDRSWRETWKHLLQVQVGDRGGRESRSPGYTAWKAG
jgi:hypothetical protein